MRNVSKTEFDQFVVTHSGLRVKKTDTSVQYLSGDTVVAQADVIDHGPRGSFQTGNWQIAS